MQTAEAMREMLKRARENADNLADARELIEAVAAGNTEIGDLEVLANEYLERVPE